MEHFITHIKVNNSRGVKNLDIPLSKEHRQHLIITGKNGSGKTSLLLEMNNFLLHFHTGLVNDYLDQKRALALNKRVLEKSPNSINIRNSINEISKWLGVFGGTEIQFSRNYNKVCDSYKNGRFLLTYFDSKRSSKLDIPKSINKINLKKVYQPNEKTSNFFLQYLVNLKADRSFARDDNEKQTVSKIDNWFQRFENRLKYIFDVDELELKFDRKTYNFNIITNDSEPFNFTNLSDGYSAIISIVAELILRMEAHDVKAYDLEGVVLIDEIETHLHVDLQKKILPFLIDFFPKIQFIVTTHSPFVLSSVSNATICDLETRLVTTDLSNYSYDAIIESYFQTDKYSDEIKSRVSEFEILIDKSTLSENEREKLIKLRNYFTHTPKHLAPELMVRLQEIELKALTKQKSR